MNQVCKNARWKPSACACCMVLNLGCDLQTDGRHWFANCRSTRICDGLCVGLLPCSSGCLASDGKKEELFYSVSPLFIDIPLLVVVTAIETGHYPLAFFDMFTSCVVRCLV